MTAEYLLGVDIGTYSSKGVLVTIDGEVAASHVIPHGMDMPKTGWFEHDADGVWWHDFVEIVKVILETSGVHPNHILGVGISAIGSCTLPIDAQGKPLRAGILYGIDTRATEEEKFLNDVIRKSNIASLQGTTLTSQASGPKIRWIRMHEPEIYKKTRWFLTSEAYIVFKLTGQTTIDIYTAGGYAPIFDSVKIRWIKEMEKYVTDINRLPEFYWSHEVVGKVNAQAARETGLAEGTPVVTGTTDAAAEAISAGLADIGDMMVMFGSSIFFILKTAQLIQAKNFWTSNFLSEGTYAFLGGMSTAGSLTRWFLEQFGQPEKVIEATERLNAYSALADLSASAPPGANGIVALPYFEGERTPIHDPKARGVIFGLSLKHTRADMYRSLLESVAYGIRHNIEMMNSEGIQAKRILAVGGGTKNQEWMQIVSDVAGISLHIPEQQIGASYGNAFLAGLGVGVFRDYKDIKRWVKMKQKITPQYEHRTVYDRNYKIFLKLYEQTKDLMHQISI